MAGPPPDNAAPRLRPVKDSLREYGRGIAGGLLFSLPLLYTMEVWWAGFTSHPLSLLGYLGATYVLLLGYNRYGGFRQDTCWFDVFTDSLEELGLGLLLSVGVLVLIGRITRGTSLQEAVGMVVVEAGTVAIGVSVGTAQLGVQSRDAKPQETTDEDRQRLDSREHVPAQVVIAFCGAVLFAANVAPTEEIVMIAVETSPWRLLGLAVLSLLLGGLILFQSDFTRAHRFTRRRLRRDVLAGTVVTYAIALVSSAGVLAFFGRFSGNGPGVCVAQVVVLGLASTLGASAGRLLIQS